jgi:hypothetical protein
MHRISEAGGASPKKSKRSPELGMRGSRERSIFSPSTPLR